MVRSKLLVLTLAAAMTISSTSVRAGLPMTVPGVTSSSPAVAYGLAGCVASIMLAALDASRRFNRELTAAEAASCGLLYWLNLAKLRP